MKNALKLSLGAALGLVLFAGSLSAQEDILATIKGQSLQQRLTSIDGVFDTYLDENTGNDYPVAVYEKLVKHVLLQSNTMPAALVDKANSVLFKLRND
ncbi:MAG: hypothetical protein IPL35_12270 [Sphingobacteriales bacterium]|nr:hypothetical protein [Sphingobacteriales bacterium]